MIATIGGVSVTYPSLEEAAMVTGLSAAAIKLRANNGSTGKDGYAFQWVSDITARHFRAKKSKTKGRNLEYEIVDKLKGVGYANVCRSAGESRRLDNDKVDIADPSGELPVAIQAKHYANFPNYFEIRSQCPDPRPFVMIWKKSAREGRQSEGTVAIMDADYFYKLIAKE